MDSYRSRRPSPARQPAHRYAANTAQGQDGGSSDGSSLEEAALGVVPPPGAHMSRSQFLEMSRVGACGWRQGQESSGESRVVTGAEVVILHIPSQMGRGGKQAGAQAPLLVLPSGWKQACGETPTFTGQAPHTRHTAHLLHVVLVQPHAGNDARLAAATQAAGVVPHEGALHTDRAAIA